MRRNLSILIRNPDPSVTPVETTIKKIRFDEKNVPDKLYVIGINFTPHFLNEFIKILPPVSILDINLAGFYTNPAETGKFFKPKYKIPDSVIEFVISGIPKLDITGFFNKNSDLRSLMIDELNETKVKTFTDFKTGKSLLPTGLVKLQFPYILNNRVPVSQHPEIMEVCYSDKQKKIIFT